MQVRDINKDIKIYLFSLPRHAIFERFPKSLHVVPLCNADEQIL